MAITYKKWLEQTGRKGTAADALMWKKSHGVALGLYDRNGNPAPQSVGQQLGGPLVYDQPTSPASVGVNLIGGNATPAAARASDAAAASAAGTAAAAPAPAPPNPVNFADPRLPGVEAQLRAVPGTFNDQRRMSANEVLRNLISQGLIQHGSLAEESSDSGILGADGAQQKNIVYKIITGPGGRLYRQAYESTRDSQNTRGFLESSQTNERIKEGRATLDRSVNDTLARLGDDMTRSLGQQREAIASLGEKESNIKADVARDLQNDPTAIAGNPVSPAGSTVAGDAAGKRQGTPISLARFTQWRKNMGRPTLAGSALTKAYADYQATFK